MTQKDPLKVASKTFTNYLTEHVYKGVTVTSTEHPKEVRDLLLKSGTANIDETMRMLNTAQTGLTPHEAARRLSTYGPNEIAREKPPAWWFQLIKAFVTPFTIILLALATTSLVTDVILSDPGSRNWTKIIIIMSIVSLSGGLR